MGKLKRLINFSLFLFYNKKTEIDSRFFIEIIYGANESNDTRFNSLKLANLEF